jgi:hypothetical protein
MTGRIPTVCPGSHNWKLASWQIPKLGPSVASYQRDGVESEVNRSPPSDPKQTYGTRRSKRSRQANRPLLSNPRRNKNNEQAASIL